MDDGDPTAALTAAWEIVRRTMMRQTDAPKANALQRFIGFFEGRLRVNAPAWWEELVLDAKADGPVPIYFLENSNVRPNRRIAVDFGIHDTVKSHRADLKAPNDGFIAPRHMEVSVTKDSWRISTHGDEVRVPFAVFEVTKGPVNSLSLLISSERIYVACHWTRTTPYDIVCIDRQTSRVIWKTHVWASGELTGVEGNGYHWVTLVEDDSNLFVFGAGVEGVYCEVFDQDDGSNRARFNSLYGAAP